MRLYLGLRRSLRDAEHGKNENGVQQVPSGHSKEMVPSQGLSGPLTSRGVHLVPESWARALCVVSISTWPWLVKVPLDDQSESKKFMILQLWLSGAL